MSTNLQRVVSTGLCAVPFACIAMQLPGSGFAALGGAAFAIHRLHLAGTRGYLVPLALMAFALGVYAVLAWSMPDSFNELRPFEVMLTVAYGVPAGTYLALLAHEAHEQPARTTWLGVAALIAAVALFAAFSGFEYGNALGPDAAASMTGGWMRFDHVGIFSVNDFAPYAAPLTVLALAAGIGVLLPTRKSEVLLIVAGVVVSVIVAYAVMRRTAIASAAASLVVAAILGRHAIGRLSLRRLAWLAALAVGAALVFSVLSDRALRREVTARTGAMTEQFTEAEGDNRFDLLAEAASLIAANPGGHARNGMTSQVWARNLVLDVGLSTGIAGMLAVSLALLVPAWRSLRVIRAGAMRESPLFHVLLAQFGAVIVASQIVRPNLSYLAFVCLFTGYVYALPRK
jgi:hypothetical protein